MRQLSPGESLDAMEQDSTEQTAQNRIREQAIAMVSSTSGGVGQGQFSSAQWQLVSAYERQLRGDKKPKRWDGTAGTSFLLDTEGRTK